MLFNVQNLSFRLLYEIFLREWNLHIINTDGDSCTGRILISDILQTICKNYGGLGASTTVGVIDKLGKCLLAHHFVNLFKRYRFRQKTTKNDTSHGSINNFTVNTNLNPCLKVCFIVVVRDNSLFNRRENTPLARNIDTFTGHIIETKYDILGWNNYRLTVSW